MKKISFFVLALVLILLAASCRQQEETAASSPDAPHQSSSASEPEGQSLASFSYEEDAALYKDGDPGVNSNEFVNTDAFPIENQTEAIERAKNECTIAYNTVAASYDAAAAMWRIDFLTAAESEDGTWATAGGCQSVYLNSDGVTQLIVYGE